MSPALLPLKIGPPPLVGKGQGAESPQSPTFIGPPALGGITALVMPKLYITVFQLFASYAGRILL